MGQNYYRQLTLMFLYDDVLMFVDAVRGDNLMVPVLLLALVTFPAAELNTFGEDKLCPLVMLRNGSVLVLLGVIVGAFMMLRSTLVILVKDAVVFEALVVHTSSDADVKLF
jgi:hypothetical protein